ncbi:tyrosinase family oxidase copper chaperone [Streptomyces flavofungini]|uniref:tyrosinase family oxidase copper chaperone n=1 Tax=Streptomyces flavofungini TaxID=68200 RepID=UPI003F7F8D1C
MRRRDVLRGAAAFGAAAALPAATGSPLPRAHVERYLGREVRMDAPHAPDRVPRVTIDGRDLALMRQGPEAYQSPLCHYGFDAGPLQAARRAVRQLRGARLLPLGGHDGDGGYGRHDGHGWPPSHRPSWVMPPARPHVRKNHLEMTREERRRFVQAVLETKRSGVYDELVAVHIQVNSADYLHRAHGCRTAHLSPSLLPWHRQYLLLFEQALREVDPSVTLPYWDWTTDRRTDSPLWAEDFMGGDGRPGDRRVTSGPFARRNGWRLGVNVRPVGHEAEWLNGHYTQDDRDHLVRAFRPSAVLSTAGQLDRTLALSVYDAPPWNHHSGQKAPYHSFRNHLEGYARFPWERRWGKLHGSAHVFVGGHMDFIGSPNDPVFFLHHCFIDKIWAEWQRRHPLVPHYLPLESDGAVPGLHTPLAPWFTMTPAGLVDHTRFYRYDT